MNDTGRTETFSDGVMAIAITLLVLDLAVPSRAALGDKSLAHALGHEWPQFAAYVTSFLVIGIIWVNHHTTFRLIRSVDRMMLFLNLLLLLFIAAIPFTTSLIAEYLTAGGRDARTAAIVYSVVMLAMSVSFGALFVYVVRHPALLEPEVDPTVLRASIRRFTLIGLALYAATVIVALFSAPACLVLHFLIALYYCFEQIRIRSA
ncbi:MAG TPA: TMEM175 family protein [Micromonosporaceae bacterium]|nr:TMEM175 family protein [Micromonosporaceae bacterium]